MTSVQANNSHRMPLTGLDSNAHVLNTVASPEDRKPVIHSETPAKRKASDIEDSDDLLDIDSDDERLTTVTDNCNQVRTKIRNFVESGAMKVGEFQKAIGVSSNAYSRFMGQNGPDAGSGCDTFYNAFAFFKKRELQGLKMPKKKVKKAAAEEKSDVSNIHLDGEVDCAVPIFETCDEVRKKIRAHLKKPDITQAGFCREISKTYPDGKKIQSKSLTDFLSKKGPSAGNTNAVFYAAYVFFEKLRIRDRKPKSKFRLEMEEIYSRINKLTGRPGFDSKTPSNRGYICRANERPHEDKYGRVTFW